MTDQAECVIRIRVAVSQEHVNAYSARKVTSPVRTLASWLLPPVNPEYVIRVQGALCA